MNRIVCVLVMIIAASVEAAPARILVLPLDGNAEPALRVKLNFAVQKIARKHSDKVTRGDTTFSETAAAVGCDPAAPDCAETVRTTLGVDELVWGTATWTNGQTNLVVYRAVAKEPTRTTSVLVGTQDPAEKTETSLAPLFGGEVVVITPPLDPSVTPPVEPVPQGPSYDNSKRTRGILFASGGGVVLLIGFALWSNASSVQQDIDNADPQDARDFVSLEASESRAFKYAMVGNVMVVAGLGLGGYGAWTLYQDRTERRSVVVTPEVTPTSATVSIGGTW